MGVTVAARADATASDHALFKWNVDILVGLTTRSLQDIIKIPAGTTGTGGKTYVVLIFAWKVERPSQYHEDSLPEDVVLVCIKCHSNAAQDAENTSSELAYTMVCGSGQMSFSLARGLGECVSDFLILLLPWQRLQRRKQSRRARLTNKVLCVLGCGQSQGRYK